MAHSLIWIIVTIIVIVVMMCLLDVYISIVRCKFPNNEGYRLANNEGYRLANNEGYWPVPYFMGEYTQNDRERYFDYMPFPTIYRKVGNTKV